jgi:hypothetical protein
VTQVFRRVGRLVAVVLVASAAGLVASPRAEASTCSSAHGVTVVVDFHQLGGGVQTACDAGGGGRTAATQLKDVGHRLVYVQRQPGFVCRVDDAPTDDPCVNTPPDNAYWSLWWSDGRSGAWSYSSLGVASLKVPEGGYVALSWQGQDSKAPPGVTPKAHPSPSPSPSPTEKPTAHSTPAAPSRTSSTTPSNAPTGGPTGKPTSAVASGRAGGPAAEPGSSRSTRPPSPGADSTPSRAAPSSDAAEAAGAAATAVDDTGDAGGSSGLPGWVAPVLVAGLLGAAATVAVVRRKRAGGA